MNLMMPSLDKQLDEYKCKIEQQIADILVNIVIFVKNMKIPLRLNLKRYF